MDTKKRLLKNAVWVKHVWYITLWFLVCYNIAYVAVLQYDVPRYVLFYKASFILLIIVLCIGKLRLDNSTLLYSCIVFAGALIKYLYDGRDSWGVEYRDLLIYKSISVFLAAIVIYDVAICKKKWADASKCTTSYVLFTIITFGFCVVTTGDYLPVILVPMIAWYAVCCDRKEMKLQLTYMSIAMYLAFSFIMTRSLIRMPNAYSGDRYVGEFIFPLPAGNIASMGLIGCIFLMYMARKKRILLASCSVAMLYPLIMLFVISSKSDILGVLLVVIGLYICFWHTGGIKFARRRLLILLGIVAGGFAVATAMVYFVIYPRHEFLETWYMNIRGKVPATIAYMVGLLVYWTSPDAYILYGEGSILNFFDRLTSGRFMVWGEHLAASKLLGHGEGAIGHAHSTYLQWIYNDGWIAGLLFIAWIVAYVVKSGKMVVEKREEFFVPFIQGLYCLGLFVTGREVWVFAPCFFLLLFQYPLFRGIKE